jgi:flagellar biosynthesis protein FlhG
MLTRTITIANGKTGVDKTTISVNIALSLAASGRRTCLFDADPGLPGVNMLLGLNPDHDLQDVISGRRNLRDIIIRDYEGIDIVPAGTGLKKMAGLEKNQAKDLIQSFSELDSYDFLIFDTPADLSKETLSFCLASSEVTLIITPEPASLTDAYVLLKALSSNKFKGTVRIVVNQCRDISAGKLVYNKFNEATQKHLPIHVTLLGIIVNDRKVAEAVQAKKPLVTLYPESNASQCIKNTTKHLLESRPQESEDPDMVSFWTRWLHLTKSPLDLSVSRKAIARQNPGSMGPSQEAGIGFLNKEEGIYPLLNGLVDSISSLSKELQLLRNAVEDIRQENLTDNDKPTTKKDQSEPDPIILDFEHFSKNKRQL